ncbi:MAG: hypothetical protein LBC92_02500 [Rickettsiales bacterium]|jgi:hypothetical protein|nr:hypothetical protein [Rickettsiales bacterium]
MDTETQNKEYLPPLISELSDDDSFLESASDDESEKEVKSLLSSLLNKRSEIAIELSRKEEGDFKDCCFKTRTNDGDISFNPFIELSTLINFLEEVKK